MGREMGGKFKRDGSYVYLWLIQVEAWQKTTTLLLSSWQSYLWKGCTGKMWIIIFFYPSIDITLASINIPPSMSGSSCEGYTFRLSGSWLPLTWELSLSRAGNPGQWEIPWPIQLAFSKQGWGGGTGGHWCTLKMWFPVKTESQLKNIWEKLPYISPS